VELTRYYSLHAGYLTGLLTLAADVRADFESQSRRVLTYSAGAEYILGQALPVRLGYSYDGFQKASQLGVGVGLMTEGGGGIDLGYRHDLGGQKGRLLALTIKMQVG
jgi:opacity protein-like surface antigen